MYEQPHNDTFCRMIETVQYNALPAITEAIKGTSCEREPYRWMLVSETNLLFNIVAHNLPDYLYILLPVNQCSYDAERNNKLF